MTDTIERDAAAAIQEIYQRAFEVLCEADVVLSQAPETPWLTEIADAHHAVSLAVMPGMLDRIATQYPELDIDRPDGPADTLLDAQEQAAVDRLTVAQVQRIDDALMSDCVACGRKVARIIGNALGNLHDELPGISAGFYSQRVRALVTAGKLDSRGDLDYMRFSEVRLARDPLADIVDAPLRVDVEVLQALKDFRAGRKRTDLAQPDPADEDDLSADLDRLADSLIQGLESHPTKRWVMAQFNESLKPLQEEDAESQERFAFELARLMEITGIDSDDGLLDFHLKWF